MSGNYLMLNGERYRVINAWIERDASDGRKRWGIVTEQPAEEQPDTAPSGEPAGATVDLTRPYCYRLDRTDQDPPGMLSWGSWDTPPGPGMTTAHHAARREIGRVRIEHNYFGPMRVWVWQRRDDEHYRADPPADAFVLDVGALRNDDHTDTIHGSGPIVLPYAPPAPAAQEPTEDTMDQARRIWPEAEGFERVPGGWTFRIGAGYAAITDDGTTMTDPQGTRADAERFMHI